MRSLRRSVRLVEHAVVRAARPDDRAGKVVAVGLAESGGYGRVWFAIAAALAAVGGRNRRAAVHGCAGWVAGEAGAAAVKRVVRRRRPALRTLGSGVSTSSFPSAHAAAAVGFAAAATTAHAPVGLAVVPLAAGVCWSRVATGRHFTTDVMAGVAIGAVAGVAVSKAADEIEQRLTSRSDRPT